MFPLLLVILGGAIGSAGRFLLAGAVQHGVDRWPGLARMGVFPLGTLAVNALGCLSIGLLGAYFAGPHRVSAAWRAFLMIGVLGGFTTFSSFAWETLSLANDGQFVRALANVMLSNVVGLTLAWGGYRVGEWAVGV